MKKQIVLFTIAVSLSAIAFAQDVGGDRRPNGGPGAPGPERQRPVPPIVAALDVNKDGIIDATEIANAPQALRSLDKNNDGVLTPDEIGGPRPGDHGGFGAPGQRPPRPGQQ
jgi:hypothetical protein